MITIQNIGQNHDGTCQYRVAINHKEITRFTHKRSDGLAVCLKLASAAVLGEDLKMMMAVTTEAIDA